ncbi:MAG: BatA domain-containing protein [Bacteroidetes bacterium]|nr:BatA domain-containing protein [Bacteroidota bacterium]MDA1121588.1 BatA domain-containing protein [Bacteroidota bacterium]
MNFLYPQFLFGLFALGIPVVIHLFNFRRAKKLYFSNVQFLENVKQTSSSKLKIRHLLVLFSRLLFILFLVLAFAQPFLPGKEEGLNNKEVLLYIDNSMSMTNDVSENISALDQGYSYLSNIVNLYSQDTRIKLLTNDFEPFSNTYKGKQEVEEQITEMSSSNTSRTLSEVINRLNSNQVGTVNPKDYYIISDFQQSTVGPALALEDTTNNYYIITVNFEILNNVYIDSVYLKDPFIIGDRENKLFARLINTGDEEVNDLVVKFFIENDQAAAGSVNILPGSAAEVYFDLNIEILGMNKCSLSFEEFPISFDNDYYFTLSRSEQINVLEIKSQDAGDAISKVFANETVFNFISYDINNLEYSSVNTSDLIVLNELTSFNSSLLPAFQQFQSNNGDIFIVPGSNIDTVSYGQFLSFIPISKSSPIEMEQLASINPKNPYFESMFETVNENFDMPVARPAISWGRSDADLMNFKNGNPYLSVFDQFGRTYLAGSPFQDDYTGFHRHALFVPTMYRAAVLSKKESNKLSYSLDEQIISIRLDSISRNIIYKLKRDEEEIIPNQRISGDQLILDLPKYTLENGFYELMEGNKMIAILAFNHSKQESKLEQLTNETAIRGVFPGISNLNIFEFGDAADFSREMKERYEGVNLWKYALILALIFMFTEVLLLRFF